MDTPTAIEFKRGYETFQVYEKRDAIYKLATFLIEYFWGNCNEMANSLGILLLIWNQAFYRYGPFDYDVLEECISSNIYLLNTYRKREIFNYSIQEDKTIRNLFAQFLVALQISEGKNKGNKSPVGTAKTLHLLAPNFFPLWDDQISRAYKCYYGFSRFPEDKYITFIRRMKIIANQVKLYISELPSGKTLLKLIDEYNYAKYTKKWI